uniref:40S ribosomal protein S19-2-like n=1 Tax=Seriola lalandi dorsalis TaxID=1841481 RepID=A0A3B4WEM0_SERLL
MSTSRGINVKDVASDQFVVAYAAHLKRIGKIEVPKWADLVKTASYKELAPYDPDWYYIRAAAMARRVYMRGGVGVGGFKKIYGGRKMRGTRPETSAKGSGSIARHILKQLEVLKIVEKVPEGKGRRITPQGQRDLDSIAGQIVLARARARHVAAVC